MEKQLGNEAMTITTDNPVLRRLIAALGAGVLALGLSATVSAHGARAGHGANTWVTRHARVAAHHRHYKAPRRGYRYKRRGHGRRHGRPHYPREVVYVQNVYSPAVAVVPVYEQPVRVIERSVPQPDYSVVPVAAAPQINAGSLMGAALGGFIGSQIGDGSGQLAATAAGAVGGFVLGDHATRGYR